MQQQEFGPDRRALMDLIFEDAMKVKEERNTQAIIVCDRLVHRWKYKDALQHFNQLDANYEGKMARWTQLYRGANE